MKDKYFTKAGKLLEILAYAEVAAAVIIALFACIRGNAIPTKYDWQGNVVEMSSPMVLFLLPLGMLVVIVILSAFTHYGNVGVFSTIEVIKPEKEEQVMKDYTLMIAIMQILMGVCVLIFTIMLAFSISTYMNLVSMLLIGAIVADVVIMMQMAKRHNR